MSKFIVFNKKEKEANKTTFGLLSVEEIEIGSKELQKYISEIILDKNNLEFIFCDKIKDLEDHFNMIKRFVPDEEVVNIEVYIENNLSENVNFYSFLAEALLPLIFKDLFDYKLASAVIGLNDTLTDGHTGADSCMYDKDKNLIVLGESKFYQDVNAGFRTIISNLTEEDGFKNKITSFKRHIENNRDSKAIIIKQLNKGNLSKLSFKEFLSMNILYSGFVLHDHRVKIDTYLKSDYYDKYLISAEAVSKNIKETFNIDEKDLNHTILFVHLPINDKKDLIKMVIEKAQSILEDIANGKISI